MNRLEKAREYREYKEGDNMAEISQNVNIEMLEKLPDGTYKRKYPKTTKEQVGLGNVDNVKQATKTEHEALDTKVTSHLSDDANPHNTNKSDVGLSNVDNVKQIPIAGGTFTGISKAHNNTSHTVAQIRNVILSTSDADVSSMGEGDIWIKYT